MKLSLRSLLRRVDRLAASVPAEPECKYPTVEEIMRLDPESLQRLHERNTAALQAMAWQLGAPADLLQPVSWNIFNDPETRLTDWLNAPEQQAMIDAGRERPVVDEEPPAHLRAHVRPITGMRINQRYAPHAA